MAERPLLAYAVTEDCDNTGGIIFARHAIVARRLGADEFNGGEFDGIICRRAPWADAYAESGAVPASVMIANGWWSEGSCGHRISEDDLAERGLPVEGVIGTWGSRLYCCVECRDLAEARRARERAAGDAFINMLKARLVRRFGPLDFGSDLDGAMRKIGSHVYAREEDGLVIIRQAIVRFGFPGMKLGPAQYRYDPGYRIGPAVPELTCCSGDREAFEAWAAAPGRSYLSSLKENRDGR